MTSKKRRTQREVIESRLRAGGMPEADIPAVLAALDAGNRSRDRRRPALPQLLTLREGRPLEVTRATLDAVFGSGHRTYEFRPYRTRDGLVAARLLPMALSSTDAPGAAAAAADEPVGDAPPVDAGWEGHEPPAKP